MFTPVLLSENIYSKINYRVCRKNKITGTGLDRQLNDNKQEHNKHICSTEQQTRCKQQINLISFGGGI